MGPSRAGSFACPHVDVHGAGRSSTRVREVAKIYPSNNRNPLVFSNMLTSFPEFSRNPRCSQSKRSSVTTPLYMLAAQGLGGWSNSSVLRDHMALAHVPATDPAVHEDALASSARTLEQLKQTQASATAAREGSSSQWEWYFGWGGTSASNSAALAPTPNSTSGVKQSNAAPRASPTTHENWPWRKLGSSGRQVEVRKQAWQQEVQKTRDFLASMRQQSKTCEPKTSETACMVRLCVCAALPLPPSVRT